MLSVKKEVDTVSTPNRTVINIYPTEDWGGSTCTIQNPPSDKRPNLTKTGNVSKTNIFCGFFPRSFLFSARFLFVFGFRDLNLEFISCFVFVSGFGIGIGWVRKKLRNARRWWCRSGRPVSFYNTFPQHVVQFKLEWMFNWGGGISCSAQFVLLKSQKELTDNVENSSNQNSTEILVNTTKMQFKFNA